MAIEIGTEFTPNPNSLKFNTNQVLLEKGTAFFSEKEKAEKSPLAKKIFEVEKVVEVMIGGSFVTVSRHEDARTWATIIAEVSEILRKHLESGEPILTGPLEEVGSSVPNSEVEKKIIEILDERIRPAVARDGGDIIFDRFSEGVVYLHLQGACSTCPSSVATLKAGVEGMLKDLIPEVREVVQA